MVLKCKYLNKGIRVFGLEKLCWKY